MTDEKCRHFPRSAKDQAINVPANRKTRSLTAADVASASTRRPGGHVALVAGWAWERSSGRAKQLIQIVQLNGAELGALVVRRDVKAAAPLVSCDEGRCIPGLLPLSPRILRWQAMQDACKTVQEAAAAQPRLACTAHSVSVIRGPPRGFDKLSLDRQCVGMGGEDENDAGGVEVPTSPRQMTGDTERPRSPARSRPAGTAGTCLVWAEADRSLRSSLPGYLNTPQHRDRPGWVEWRTLSCCHGSLRGLSSAGAPSSTNSDLRPASLRHQGRAAIGYSSAAEPLGTIVGVGKAVQSGRFGRTLRPAGHLGQGVVSEPPCPPWSRHQLPGGNSCRAREPHQPLC
jgi:hypothetical protein